MSAYHLLPTSSQCLRLAPAAEDLKGSSSCYPDGPRSTQYVTRHYPEAPKWVWFLHTQPRVTTASLPWASSPSSHFTSPPPRPHQAWPMKLAYHFGLRGWFGYGCGVFPSPGQVQLAGCECRTVGHHLSHHLSLRTCLGRKQQVGEQICEKERDIPRTNLQASI